ncbi:alpha/beta hydrolase [Marinobacterium sp. MBR-109]|jgi:2-hydroxymuconate-semialdehyde hydrolase|uniref:alpha/beta fold hydrolase n=1 Tax=Marinobacterium sp. MBR-109 TaxID=3156462 RepID=UPI0033965C34
MELNTDNPEIAQMITAAGFKTNLHDYGDGFPLMMIHGSGPGVTAWANWRLVMPELAKSRRIVAPDMLGFGYSERPEGITYNRELWVKHAVGVLDALGLDQVDLLGNSFGGGIALALALAYPQRVRRLILMGSTGTPFTLTEGLDAVWGYTPSIDNMRRLLDIFAYDRTLVTDDLAELRYQASISPGFQEAFSQMFPTPRQKGINELSSPEGQVRQLPHETLILHGREDEVIPLSASLTLHDWIKNSQLHVFGCCGHWTQIEHSERFVRLVNDFLDEAGKESS